MKINGKPDGGGGGGVITSLSISANGTYTAGGGVDGYNPVNVSVPEQKPEETFSVTPSIAAQTVTPQEGYVFSGGTVAAVTSTIDGNIQSGNIKSGVTILGVEGTYTAPAPVTESLSVSINGTYTPGQGVDGFSQVVVNVPQSVTGYTIEQVLEGNIGITVLSSPVSYMVTVGCWSFIETASLPNVKSIPDNAFFNGLLSSVYIPNCEYIGRSAFNNCAYLSQVYCPNVISIQEGGFQNCQALTSIDLPNCEYIEGGFQACYSLSYISLPKCKYIGNYAFQNCGLTSIDLPNCLELTYGIFYYCQSLSRAYIPVCMNLQDQAFYGCHSLTDLTIAMETYYIPEFNGIFDETPFTSGVGSIYVADVNYDKIVSAEGWSSISSLIVSVSTSYSTMLSFSNGLVYGDTKYIRGYFWQYLGIDQNDILEVDLQNCTTVLGNGLAELYSVTSINLPNCVKLSFGALQYNQSLTSVSLPVCEYIDNYVFNQCGMLNDINLPACSYIGSYFIDHNLSTLTLGYSSVCIIKDNFWVYFDNTSIYVPASLVSDYQAAENWAILSSRIFPISSPEPPVI